VTLQAENNQNALTEIKEKFNLSPALQNGNIVFSVSHSDTFLPEFMRQFSGRLLSINIHRPTLDDVFLNLTGHAIREQGAEQWGQ